MCVTKNSHLHVQTSAIHAVCKNVLAQTYTGTRNVDFQMRTPIWRAYTYTHIGACSARLGSVLQSVCYCFKFTLFLSHKDACVCCQICVRLKCFKKDACLHNINAYYKTCLKLKRVYHNITFLFFYSSI